MGWESRDTQEARFAILTRTVDLRKKSILDVGCGVGSLCGFLERHAPGARYTGVDLSEEFLAYAAGKYPHAEWLRMDVLSNDLPVAEASFDVVFSSGLLNLRYEDNEKYLRLALERFLYFAREYVVFNMLRDTSLMQEEEYYYYNEQRVKDILSKMNLSFRVDSSYLMNDMSVIVKVT